MCPVGARTPQADLPHHKTQSVYHAWPGAAPRDRYNHKAIPCVGVTETSAANHVRGANVTRRLTSISIYPIKGTRAISLPEAEVRTRGLASDRRWLVVDENGRFITQRTHPRIGLVSTAVHPDGTLTMAGPDMDQLVVAPPTADSRMSVSVWDDTIAAAGGLTEADRWFSQYLQTTCHLVFMDQGALRPVAPPYGQPGDEVSFADAVPVLLANDASLLDLNRRLASPLPMSRFRPNITVDGEVPWDEDHWQRLRVGSVEFVVTHRCARCVVTTIDQETGTKAGDGEPLKTLATFRRDEKGVYFGQNLVPRSTGIIHVGDPVEILERT